MKKKSTELLQATLNTMPGKTKKEKTINMLLKTFSPKKGEFKELALLLVQLISNLTNERLAHLYNIEGEEKLLKAKVRFIKTSPKIILVLPILAQDVSMGTKIDRSTISMLMKKTKTELFDQYYVGVSAT